MPNPLQALDDAEASGKITKAQKMKALDAMAKKRLSAQAALDEILQTKPAAASTAGTQAAGMKGAEPTALPASTTAVLRPGMSVGEKREERRRAGAEERNQDTLAREKYDPSLREVEKTVGGLGAAAAKAKKKREEAQ